MLIWLNGAYGAGKTSVARNLAARLGNAPIVDPEEIGFMLRRVLPGEPPGDFQDLPIWRRLVVEVLAEAQAVAGGTIIVPMTLANPAYFREIVEELRKRDVEVRHFTLLAPPRTLRFRLLKRLDRPAATRWCLAQVDRCAAELEKPDYAVHVATRGVSIAGVADGIMRRLS